MLQTEWAAAGAWLLHSYLSAVAEERRVDWYRLSAGNRALALCNVDDVARLLEEISAQRRILIPLWNAASMLLVCAYIASPRLRPVADRLEAVADDSPGGKLSHFLFRRIGLRHRLIRHRSETNRLEDLATLIRKRPNLVLAIDSHGPYRVVGMPAARLAKTMNSIVVPATAFADRDVKIFSRIGMSFPLPKARIKVAIAPPISCGTSSVDEIRMEMANALEALEAGLRSIGNG